MDSAAEIEHLQQIIDELKQEILELRKHNELLQDENSKLTDMLDNVELSTTDDDDDDDDDDTEEFETVDEEADCEENSQWLPLKGFDDYVIKNFYPYDIKRVSTNHVVKDGKRNGYPSITLYRGDKHNTFNKHVLIARQFIPNDDPKNKCYVDHKNKHRDDYHISNLRWVTASENNQNKSSSAYGIEYEFVKEIPGDAIVVNSYGKHTFENYYFHDNKFYFYNGIEYRILHICTEKRNGSKFVHAMSTVGKKLVIRYSRFKKMYDLE